jgi:hypothetical protein
MSAYHAPSGTVYEIGRLCFITLDGYSKGYNGSQYRNVYLLTSGILDSFGVDSQWDLNSTRVDDT